MSASYWLSSGGNEISLLFHTIGNLCHWILRLIGVRFTTASVKSEGFVINDISTASLFTHLLVFFGSEGYIERQCKRSALFSSIIHSRKFSITVKVLSSNYFLSRIRISKRLSVMGNFQIIQILQEFVFSSLFYPNISY